MRRMLRRASEMLAVSTAGAVLVAAGIVLLFLPGPGLLVIFAGVAVLAREFRWARRLRDWLVRRFTDLRTRARARRIIDLTEDEGLDLDGADGDGAGDRDDVSVA